MTLDVARRFDAMAATYDVLEPWYEHLYEVMHRILRLTLARGSGRALDAGCGTGFQAALLRGFGYETHGLDIAAGMLAVARRRLPKIPAVQGTIEELPYATGCFDAIVCCGSTLSFASDAARALREFGRVLRPDGVLLLECEHRGRLDLAWALVNSVTGDRLGYGLTPSQAWRQIVGNGADGVWTEYPGYGPMRLFRARELRALLRAARLTPVKVWGIHAATNLIPSTVLHRERVGPVLASVYRGLRALDRRLARFPPARAIANSLMVLARKDGTATGVE
jgi:SAM-dependent methyltransferase